MKKRGWKNRLVHWILAAGIIMGLSSQASVYQAQGAPDEGRKVISEIDFSTKGDLNSLEENWHIDAGSGSALLVDGGDGKKALELSRTADGNAVRLFNDKLNIEESEYPYISVETRIKLGTQNHSNQWSIPYIRDKSGKVGYTLFVDGDWNDFKTHVGNSSNKQIAGKAGKGKWHDVRMDIDLTKDTFRVSVDDAYVLYDENAREKVNNLSNIQFYSDSWNRGTVYIESIKITGQKKRTESKTSYVSNEGNDLAAGTEESTAWESLSRVNSEHFIPGDKILFRRGDEWKDQTLFPQGNGSEGSYIKIGSYGSGEIPKISTNGKAQDALCFYNQNYWEISELDISNTVPGFTQTTDNGAPPTGNNAKRNDNDGSFLGDFRGIHITGRDERYLKGYHIHNVNVHDVTGEVGWIGNTGLKDKGICNNMGLDGSKRTGGILIECLKPSKNTPTQFSDILIKKK